MSYKKGQSSVEYITTYGWAILVLVIIIGLLFSTGIFSPGYLVTEECSLGPKLPCSHLLFNDGNDLHLILNITNGFESKIKIDTVKITMTGNKEMLIKISNEYPVSGQSIRIDATLAGYNAAKDSSKKFQVTITYYSCALEVNPKCDAIPAHTINGRITAKAN